MHNKGKLFGLQMGGEISSIISIIFKRLSFHATRFGPVWLVKIPVSILLLPSAHSHRGLRKAWKVRAQQTEICQVAQQAETPKHTALTFPEHLNTEEICPLRKRRNKGCLKWYTEMERIQDANQKKKKKGNTKYKRICYQIIRTKEIISSEKKRGIFFLNGSTVQNLRIQILPQYSANSRFLSYKVILCW